MAADENFVELLSHECHAANSYIQTNTDSSDQIITGILADSFTGPDARGMLSVHCTGYHEHQYRRVYFGLQQQSIGIRVDPKQYLQAITE